MNADSVNRSASPLSVGAVPTVGAFSAMAPAGPVRGGQQQQQQQQQQVGTHYVKKKSEMKTQFQALEAFNNKSTLDVDDPSLNEINDEEEDVKKILTFIHKDYNEHLIREKEEKRRKRKRKHQDEESEGSTDCESEKLSDDSEVDATDEEPPSKEELTKLLMENLDKDQMDRYEAYRRTQLNKPGIKKIATSIFGQNIPPNFLTVLSGISKVFVGEIVEKAKDVQKRYEKAALVEANLKKKVAKKEQQLKKLKPDSASKISVEANDLNKAPLRPEHIREAWRLYQLENGTTPSVAWRSQGGDGDGMFFR